MKYENRIVLFLDILGFKNIIDKTVNKEKDIEENIEKLYNNLTLIKVFLVEKLKQENLFFDNRTLIRDSQFTENNFSLQVTQFSDSIIISFQNDNNDTLLRLIRAIQELIIKLANEGILSRGAISYGKLIHNDKLIFGPALNDAYETETRAAIYPRIIMDKSIIELGNKGQLKIFEKEKKIKEDLIFSYLNKDSDDKYYIDYFPTDIGSYKYMTNVEIYLSNLRQIIIYGLRNQKPDLKVKYGWMKNKYNRMLTELKKENKIFEISKISGLFEYIDKLELLN